jgi:tetratricopeptide (TPR) repeat protein/transcriptional regulator with XRE-family HTH domain
MVNDHVPENPAGDDPAVRPATFGELVRNYRHRSGLSQEELADRAGVTARGLRKIEMNRVDRPRPSTVRLLADALGLTGTSRNSFCEAGAAHGTAADPASQPAAVAPAPRRAGATLPPAAQLPADIVGFIGRTDQVRRLSSLLEDARHAGRPPTAVLITAIAGTAGVGKTSLAVHWAHQVRHRFPDGQLYVNLRGFDPAGPAMHPAEAIRRFLDALDVPASRLPTDLDAQAALYRTLLADLRMLILLDNARDADQVRPLLPGAPGCLVVVTSRDRLSGLVTTEGALPLPLDLLSVAEARELLTARLGRARVEAEPEAVDDIISRCCRLPLALAIAAARAATHPTFPLRTLAAELRDAHDRLDALAGDEPATDVRAVFSWSYQAVSPAAIRLFRLLGLHPGPDVSVAAAASLAGAPHSQGKRLLSELARAHLIVEHAPGRYNFHDLLRVYATEQAAAAEQASDRKAAVHRVLDHYVHTAMAAALLLSPSRDPIAPAPEQSGVTPERLADAGEAFTWFAVERPVLLAAIDRAGSDRSGRFDGHVWRLAWAMVHFLDRQGHWHDWAASQDLALAAAQRLDDQEVTAMAYRFRALADIELQRFDTARGRLAAALEIYLRAGDPIGEAYTHVHLGMAEDRQGRHAQALVHSRRALDLFRTGGHRYGQSLALNNLGWLYAQLGDYPRALTACEQAIIVQQELESWDAEGSTWDSLGYIHHRLSDDAAASSCYQRAIDLQRRIGDRHGEAVTLTHLGDVHHAGGRFAAARQVWRHALAILNDIGGSEVEPLRNKLASLTRRTPTEPAAGAGTGADLTR